MRNLSIDLSAQCDPSTIACLLKIRDLAKNLEVDFFVVGALARRLILEQYYDLPIRVATLDIDIAITVADWDRYEKLREGLIFSKSFTPDAKVYHRLWFNKTHPVDLIPFGAVETSDGLINWPPDHSITMNVTGFQDSFNDAIHVNLADNLWVRFVSLPGMAVLKLIAWRDRHHEFPVKDAVDIATLLKYYPEAGNEERMFAEHADLMAAADFEFETAGARLLGRDMAKIMGPQTRKMIMEILTFFTDPDGNDRLIQAISRWLPGQDYEMTMKLLQNLKSGIQDLP